MFFSCLLSSSYSSPPLDFCVASIYTAKFIDLFHSLQSLTVERKPALWSSDKDWRSVIYVTMCGDSMG